MTETTQNQDAEARRPVKNIIGKSKVDSQLLKA